MADPDPNTPQVVDPERVVNLTRLLQIRGPLGVLNVLDTIVPVVNMGDVVTRTVTVLQPNFRSTDVFSAGIQVAAAPGTVHADTGPLAEGVYDIHYYIEIGGTTNVNFAVNHRDAADLVNLARWEYIGNFRGGPIATQTLAYEFAANERLQIRNIVVAAAGVGTVASIFARLRT